MKRCVKCHNKISSDATRCGMCGRHTSALVNYRWPILLALAALAGAAATVVNAPL